MWNLPPTHVWVAWGAKGLVGSWAPCFLSDESWTRSGDLSLREPPTEICFLLARTGPWSVRIEPWYLALPCQNREDLFGGDLQVVHYLTMT